MTRDRFGVSRLSAWLLGAVLSRDRAGAILGDINEELARRTADRRPPLWPRAWVECRALDYGLAAIWSALPLSVRSLCHAVRDGLRSFRQAPATTAFIVLILTLGITAATVTFSVVDTVVLRQLPFDRSDELVVLSSRSSGQTLRVAAAPEYVAWRDGTDAFTGLAAIARGGESLRFGADVEQVLSARTTANLFDVLRVHPLLGQAFTARNEVKGADAVAVIGYGLWERRFGADPNAIGRTLQLRSGSAVIIGVMPAGFTYPIGSDRAVELWTPYVIPQDELDVTRGISQYLIVVGRLRPNVSRDQALAQIDAATQPLITAFPKAYRDWPPQFTPLYDSLVGNVRGWMLLVLGAVGLVMLVACVNVANLQLARSTYRARELAIRASLGATRRQLVIALLVESLLLSMCAAGLGLLLATWGVGIAKAALPPGVARAGEIALDARVLGAAVAAAVLTGLLVGSVPAWQSSRTDLVTVLKDSATTLAGSRGAWRSAFVVLEVAFVGVLLVATTLFVSSFIRVTRADLGFVRSHLIAVGPLSVSGGQIATIAEPLRGLAGVTSVAALSTSSPPLINAAGFGGGLSSNTLQLPDAPADAEPVSVETRRVSPEYFQTAGITFLHGSVFDADREDAVVIDELAARQLFGHRPAVGATLNGRGPLDHFTVTGVVANVRINGPERASGPQAYFSIAFHASGLQFLLRTAQGPESIVPAVKATLTRLLPAGQPVPQVVILDDAFRRITAARRFNAGLMSIFGVLALFIGAAGMYAVMASVVAQHTREIGVRVALGATGARIRRDVITQAGRYLLAGLALGLPAAWWVSRTFASLLFEVRPTDLLVYVAVAGLLIVVGVTAALVPARRAARVNPLIALRS